MIPFLSFIIFAIPLPLSTVLVLSVSLGTDIFPSIAYAWEDAELDILTRFPRRPH
jgi:sodium/potassium-transporting ATPase subunit alpha